MVPTSSIRIAVFTLAIIAFVIASSYIYYNSQTLGRTSLSAQVSTSSDSQVAQPAYSQPTVSYFGNNYFEPPSAILIPADTLIWTNFKLSANNTLFVSPTIVIYPFPGAVGTNITVAVYLNGDLVASSTTPVADSNYRIDSSLIPSANSSNSVFSLRGLTPTVGVGTQTSSAVNVNGVLVSIAVVSDRSIWLAGWTSTDMSNGSGPQFGKSTGQLADTYESAQSGVVPGALPNLLPQATNTLTFELQVAGELSS